MDLNLSISEFRDRFSEFIERVMKRGDRITLLDRNHPVAEIRPVRSGTRLEELPELMDKLPRLGKHIADEFARDIENLRAELAGKQVRNPWDS